MFRKFRNPLILMTMLALLIVLIRRPKREPKKQPAPVEIPIPPEPIGGNEPDNERPITMEQAESPEDDLTVLIGIGPKNAKILQNEGIKTFA